MPIEKITADDLRDMEHQEGLVLQGCGGEAQEWLDGINDLLTQDGILQNGSRFETVKVFQHDGLTNLLFPFEGIQVDMGKLAMWRLQTHGTFGGTWLSDYVPNRLGGFRSARQEKPRPLCSLLGQDGNIFHLMGIAARVLRQNGMAAEAKEMQARIMGGACHSYEEALGNSPTLDESRLHNAILAAMNEYAAIRQEVCPDVLAMVEEAKRAMSQAGAMLLELKKRMDAVSQEQSDVLDRLLANMADAELNARMKALTDEKEALKAQILKVQQKEVSMAEQAAKRQQMWDSLMECSAGYTEFDDEFVRQIIQKITVEDAETIRVHFRDSDVVLEQEVE